MEVSKEIRKDAVDYAMQSITDICENIGPRESGMEAERKTQEKFKDDLLNNGWADEAEIEDFTVSRHALVGFTKIIGVFLIVAAVLQLFALLNITPLTLAVQITGIVLVTISLLITVLEFLFYVPFIDKFLPQTQSCNTYAVHKASGEVKRRIILNGHADSAYEWTLMKIRQEVMVVVLVFDLLCAFASLGIFIANAVKGATELWSIIFACVTIPVYIGLFFVCNFRVLSPGANDNLTGCYVAISALKCLAESNIRYENTEVCALLTGSEEAGLRGATAWSKKHKKDVEEVETYVVSFDTMRDYDDMTIYYRDMTGIVKNDPDVVALLDVACENIGHPLKHGIVPFGASDAAAFSKCGVKAAAVAGQNPKYAPYYHNRRDKPDQLIPETFALGLDIALSAVEAFDKK